MEKQAIKLNNDQRIFIIPAQGGFTTLGYDVCHEKAKRMAKWLGRQLPDEETKGTLEGYEQYRWLVDTCRDVYERTGERCPTELNPQLIGLEGKRVEVLDEDGETRRFIVGKSTGWIPCHLEILTRRSRGGGPASSRYKSVRVIG